MHQKYNPALRVISTIVLSFFLWTFGGVFEVAYAVKESGKQSAISSQQKQRNIAPPGQSPTPNTQAPREKRAEEKFSKAIEDIGQIIGDQPSALSSQQNQKERLKEKKAEIETLEVEIRKQFTETELKIKDLPEEIKKRHRDFVRHYDDNLRELKANLEDIDRAKTDAEKEQAHRKTKAHLEKVKPPKKHRTFNPNKLPHRTEEPIWKEPRTKPEEFEIDSAQQSAFSRKPENQISPNPSLLKRGTGAEIKSYPTWAKGGEGGFFGQSAKPILLAMNGEPTGLLSSPIPSPKSLSPASFDTPIPNTSSLGGSAWGGQSPTPILLALANPPTTADLEENGIEIVFTPAIRAKAAELGYKPVKIYEWVRNNIEYVPTYGSIQGADMCLQTKLCNDFDAASLLIALLRVSGIHARYVYGTIELPIEKVKNWAGGFTDTMSALSLFASAGVPTKGMTVGGEIKYARLEHTWVEAFIDYIPSRGSRHKTGEGDTWIPLDASFKQYTYTQGLDIKTAVPFDAQTFIDQLKNTATINEAQGYVTGVNSLLVQQTMQDYQSRVQNYISQNYPNATVGDVLGKKEIIKKEFPYLLGTLPYKPLIKGATYSSIPDSKRHKITFSVVKDSYDEIIGTPINITKSLPELAGKKLTLSYSPATQADENVINSYLPKPHKDGTPIQPSELPSSLPAYLINLKPELRIDGVVVATGTVVTMGKTETFTMTFSGPGLNANDVIRNDIEVGEYLGIGLDLGRVSQEQMTALKTKLEATKEKLQAQDFTNMTKDDVLGDLLYTTALSYLAQLGVMNDVMAKTMGVSAIILPSETIFSSELKVTTFFGSPLKVSPGGLAMDADRLISLVKALDGTKDMPKQFMLASGMNSSTLEHSVPEQLFSIPDNPAQGISAVKALQIANEQGIPIYTINQTNIAAILPQLQLDSDTLSDIQNAVNAGKIVTVSKTDITVSGWTGCGYIIIDPNTGAGAYMISGGMNGAYLMMAIGATEIFIGMCLLGTPFFAAGIIAIIQGITIFIGGLALFISNDFSQKEIAYYICMLPNYIGNLLSTLVGGLAEPLIKPVLMFAFEYFDNLGTVAGVAACIEELK